MGREKFNSWLGLGAPIPEPKSRTKRIRVDKPKWGKLGDKGKAGMVRGILVSTDHKDEFNSLVEQIEKKDREAKTAAKKTSVNITVLPSITIMNTTAGGAPVLPINLNGNPPRINFEVGGSHGDNTVTELVTLVDSGAGCTIGWSSYFEAVFLNNPSILVKIYTCVDGSYSPITMHGVVDAAAGAITTDQIACRIQNVYALPLP